MAIVSDEQVIKVFGNTIRGGVIRLQSKRKVNRRSDLPIMKHSR